MKILKLTAWEIDLISRLLVDELEALHGYDDEFIQSEIKICSDLLDKVQGMATVDNAEITAED